MANSSSKGTAPRNSKAAQSKTPPLSGMASTRKPRTKLSAQTQQISPDLRQQMISEAAYLRAEQRGFSPADPLDDWLAAEREVDLLLGERDLQVQQ